MLEIVRMVTDQLLDPLEGVEAQLALLTKDLPGDVMPLVVPFIADETRDNQVADGLDPPSLPAIYVTEYVDPLVLEGEVYTNDHRDSVEGSGVSVAFVLFEANANAIEGAQARTYIMRAVIRSLRLLLDNTGSSRVIRNGSELVSCDRFTVGRWVEKLQEAMSSAAVVGLFRYRDNNP